MFSICFLQFSNWYSFSLCTSTHVRSNHFFCSDENGQTRRTFPFCFGNGNPKTGSIIGKKRKLYGHAISQPPSISSTLQVVIVSRIICGRSSQACLLHDKYNASRKMQSQYSKIQLGTLSSQSSGESAGW